MPRKDRSNEALRNLKFTTDIAPNAIGSALIELGNTRVICAASYEPRVPGWMIRDRVQGGWISAEYSMLPYSTLDRKKREISQGKKDARSTEIQRLIGRSLRSVIDLKLLDACTLWIDCDVLQADGGTRTAAITGAYVAARLAVHRLIKEDKLKANPFKEAIASVSVGVCKNELLLDLDYNEDSNAEVDLNVVMSDSGKFVEIQGTGEQSPFSENTLNNLLSLAKSGIKNIFIEQQKALAKAMF